MINYLEVEALKRFLVQIVTPIYRIIEDPNAQDPQMGQSLFSLTLLNGIESKLIKLYKIAVEIQTLAQEVQELLQNKIGVTAYSTIHTTIRQKAAIKRNERKTATALQVCLFSPSLLVIRLLMSCYRY